MPVQGKLSFWLEMSEHGKAGMATSPDPLSHSWFLVKKLDLSKVWMKTCLMQNVSKIHRQVNHAIHSFHDLWPKLKEKNIYMINSLRRLKSKVQKEEIVRLLKLTQDPKIALGVFAWTAQGRKSLSWSKDKKCYYKVWTCWWQIYNP